MPLELLDAVLPLLAQDGPVDPGDVGGNALGWLADPRSLVLLVLGSVVLIGGGRRVLKGIRSRRAIDRLRDPRVTPEQALEAADHGREGITELFRLLGEARDPSVREAAGRALAILWEADELVAEEEQAVARRGFEVHWNARRRYPRGIATPIPIEVSFGVPFLESGGRGVAPEDLEWSHRIAGSGRASLETSSPWSSGVGLARFPIVPGDFESNGPHRLVLQVRVRTAGALTSRWEIELPHIPFTFEFDPRLELGALETVPDVAKGDRIAAAVRLSNPLTDDDDPTLLELPGGFVLIRPPLIEVARPLPSDLAHRVLIEFEGVAGQFPAGSAIVPAEGPAIAIPIGPIEGLPPDAINRPGEFQLRAILEADSSLGWADPNVRSLWPGSIATAWHSVRVIRR